MTAAQPAHARGRPVDAPNRLARACWPATAWPLARAISQRRERGRDRRTPLLAALYPHTGRAHIIGVTGAPGTGKSTLVTALAQSYRAAGHDRGVVAIDPTSPFTGGALLGDRVRMRALSGDDGVFIRSMATRGSLGGLSKTTGDVVTLLDAAGFDRILVETVGVGQAEVEIASTAHTTLVVEAPGLGDEVQAIKAGILEIADILVVNKADRPGADRTVRALSLMLEVDRGVTRALYHHGDIFHLALPVAAGEDGWQVEILETAAVTGDGVAELAAKILAHADMPSLNLPGRKSANHGGCGQNCLFEDGHVSFIKGDSIGEDAIFVNDYNMVAPGVRASDNVIAPSHLSPAVYEYSLIEQRRRPGQ